MGAAASRLVEARNLHHTDPALHLGRLAQVQGSRVVAGEHTHRQGGEGQARALGLQSPDLLLAEGRPADLDRRVLRTDGEREGGGVEVADQDLREQMLRRVLLHVVVAAGEIELQPGGAGSRVAVQQVDDFIAVVFQRQQGQVVERSNVGRLAAACGAEDRALQTNRPAAGARLAAGDVRGQLPQVRVALIDLLGHAGGASCLRRADSTNGWTDAACADAAVAASAARINTAHVFFMSLLLFVSSRPVILDRNARFVNCGLGLFFDNTFHLFYYSSFLEVSAHEA
jgi:hypothetical protein